MLTIESTITSRRKANEKLQAENDVASRQISTLRARMSELAVVLGTGQEALKFLEEVANSRRGAIKKQIEDIVTEAVQIVYGQDSSVELVYDVKSGRSSAEIEFVRDIPEGQVRRSIDGIGGGVSDTISVPLRLLVLLASRDTDRVCILDECYKHMDVDRIERVAQFLHDIAAKLGIQVVMSSHHEIMQDYADTVHEVSESGGVSTVRRTK